MGRCLRLCGKVSIAQNIGGSIMSDKELVTIMIDHYGDLQRIKQDNEGHENKTLDYIIKITVAKLSALGVNIEDITLN